MKIIIATLAFSSVIILGGCNKTKKVSTVEATTLAEPHEMEVNVEVENGEILVMINGEEAEVEGGEIVVMINGEEQVIVLSEIMERFNIDDLSGIDGDADIYVIATGDDDQGGPMGWMHRGDFKNVQVHTTVNGEEFDGSHEGMREHMMQMMNGNGSPEGMREHMMRNRGDRREGGGPPEDMREHRMQRMGEDGERGEWREHDERGEWREHDERGEWREHDERGEWREHDERGEWREHDERGEWREHDEYQDVPEEHQFMEEISILDEMSHIMTPSSMAMLGIHMIRDQLEPENRLEALERIIDEAAAGSTSRNAALIVAIETLHELDRQDEATDMMVELVLSN
jgi:hypothetical protein